MLGGGSCCDWAVCSRVQEQPQETPDLRYALIWTSGQLGASGPQTSVSLKECITLKDQKGTKALTHAVP